VGVLSILLYLPFWFALRSQAGGILPNLFNATKLQQFVVMFLPLLVPIIGLTIGAGRRRSIRWAHALGLGIGLMVLIAILGLAVGSAAAAPYLNALVRGESVQGYSLDPETAWAALRGRLLAPWTGLLLACGVGIALTAIIQPSQAMKRRRAPRSAHRTTTEDDTFPLLLALVGLLLTLAPEFVYLQDVFVTRMNTIFKFYFQAWVLWALAGAWQLSQWLTRPAQPDRDARRNPAGRAIAVGLSLLCVGMGLVYTILAVPARAREQGVPWTLDGAAWLQASQPEDAAAIAWLNAHVEGAPIIVETPGDQHKAYVYEGRVSALTGLPTVLGWGGHQRQWRGNYDEPAAREGDLNTLLTTSDEALAREILDRYDVAYIYVGPLEHQRYPESGLAKFAAMFPAVYDDQGVTIYQVTSDGAPGDLR
jgi:YYY domain-containing protein